MNGRKHLRLLALRKPLRRGFTLLELAAVTALIAILVGLMLVAVNAARESARRTQCLNNLRQLGIGFASYHAAQACLPPAVIWSPEGEPLGGGILPIGVIDRVARYGDVDADTIYANWAVMLLPHLDQTALYGQFATDRPMAHSQNVEACARTNLVMVCPSDPYCEPGRRYFRGKAAGLDNRPYARGNYGLNVGPDRDCIEGIGSLENPCHGGFLVRGSNLLVDNRAIWGSGVGGVNRSFRLQDITDGASQTIVLDEIRAGVSELDPRGSWALGQVGASLTARHGGGGDSAGPNALASEGDEIIGCGELTMAAGSPARLGMPCLNTPLSEEINAKCGARSLHPKGVNVLCADGAAHFLGEAIQANVWNALHTRWGSEAIGDRFP